MNAAAAVLKDLGGRRRWLTPLAYAAGTVSVVFDGVLLLIRDWRLTLLQLVPAVWISAMTWNLRTHFLANPNITTTPRRSILGAQISAAASRLVAFRAPLMV